MWVKNFFYLHPSAASIIYEVSKILNHIHKFFLSTYRNTLKFFNSLQKMMYIKFLIDVHNF